MDAGPLPSQPPVSGTWWCLVALLRLGTEKGISGGSRQPDIQALWGQARLGSRKKQGWGQPPVSRLVPAQVPALPLLI